MGMFGKGFGHAIVGIPLSKEVYMEGPIPPNVSFIEEIVLHPLWQDFNGVFMGYTNIYLFLPPGSLGATRSIFLILPCT